MTTTTTTKVTVRVAGSLTGEPGTYREAHLTQSVPAVGTKWAQARAARDAVLAAVRETGHRMQVTAYVKGGKSEAWS
jgi:hypothetical protein